MKVVVYGSVAGIGIRAHVIDAEDKTDAWARFCRAYSARKCEFIAIETMMGEPVWTKAKIHAD